MVFGVFFKRKPNPITYHKKLIKLSAIIEKDNIDHRLLNSAIWYRINSLLPFSLSRGSSFPDGPSHARPAPRSASWPTRLPARGPPPRPASPRRSPTRPAPAHRLGRFLPAGPPCGSPRLGLGRFAQPACFTRATPTIARPAALLPIRSLVDADCRVQP